MLYKIFYRKAGVRILSQFSNPKMLEASDLLLPIGSLVHYVSPTGVTLGLSNNDQLVRASDKTVLTIHVDKLITEKGGPRPTSLSTGKLSKEYHRKNRKFRPLRRAATMDKDMKSLVVYNYAILEHTYKYTASFYASYYKWFNIESTMWANILETAETSERQQFIPCMLPATLPLVADLKKAAGKPLTKGLLDVFNSGEALRILELYTWLGEHREYSMLGKASQATLDKINLLWEDSGRWCVLNLGTVNTWITSEGSEVDSLTAQRYLIRMMLSMINSRSSSTKVAMQITHTDDDAELDDAETAISKEVIVKEDDEAIDVEILQLTPDTPVVDKESSQEAVDLLIESEPTVDSGVMLKIDELAATGSLSVAEYKRFMRSSVAFKTLPNPITGEGTLEDLATVTKEDLKIVTTDTIPEMHGVSDKSMLQSSVMNFDKGYVERVLDKDIASAVLSLQKSGIAVTNYKTKDIKNAVNSYRHHTVQVLSPNGETSTLTFKVPKVESDGSFIVDGSKQTLRKQRGDLPLRKTSPNTVALTSYISKLFITRSIRRTNDVGEWLIKNVLLQSEGEDGLVAKVTLSDSFDHTLKVPRDYSRLSTRFSLITFKNGIVLDFKWKHRLTGIDPKVAAKLESDGLILVGGLRGTPLLMDKDSVIYKANVKTGEHVILGTVASLLELNMAKQPIEVAEVKIFSKVVPIGILLGFHLGLTNLISLLGLEIRRVPTGTRVVLAADELSIKFANEVIVFPSSDRAAAMILNGFHSYRKTIIQYSSNLFEETDVWYNVLEANGVTVPFVRQMAQLREQFIDDITLGILQERNEPTKYVPLIVEAVRMLTTDWHPSEVDLSYQRIRGYERFAGAIHAELAKSIRSFNSKPPGAKAKLTINPEAIWQQILTDPAVALADDANPMYNVRDKEVVIFGGTGGRSTRSLVARTRVFGEADVGVISESTVDNGDAGAVTYLTADPNLTSLRGTTRHVDFDTDGPAKLMGTAALMAVAADRDDPKRVNFIGIQQQSAVFSVGGVASPVSTGYDRVLAHRVDPQFAYAAMQEGGVREITDRVIIVDEADGSETHHEIGRVFGKAKDLTMPHEIVANCKVGDRVAIGDIIHYNSNYFQRDMLNPKQVVWKAGIIARTAIMESVDTLEDSSVISERLSGLLTTKYTKIRTLVVPFTSTVRDLVKIGNSVTVESILCTIEDSGRTDSTMFDEESKETLKLLETAAPAAKLQGVVEKIEVLYNGAREDMDNSLRNIVNASDREFKARSEGLGQETITGDVGKGFRVEGKPLVDDSLVIKIYITGGVGTGVGDKGVFCNQLKTVFGRVMSGTNKSESGLELDAIFGYQSISDRIVTSPILMGMSTTLLMKIGEKAVNLYRGK